MSPITGRRVSVWDYTNSDTLSVGGLFAYSCALSHHVRVCVCMSMSTRSLVCVQCCVFSLQTYPGSLPQRQGKMEKHVIGARVSPSSTVYLRHGSRRRLGCWPCWGCHRCPSVASSCRTPASPLSAPPAQTCLRWRDGVAKIERKRVTANLSDYSLLLEPPTSGRWPSENV